MKYRSFKYSRGRRPEGFDRMGNDREPALSRTLLEEPARAPARSALRNIGYSAQDLRQPIAGVSHSWTGSASGGAALSGLDEN